MAENIEEISIIVVNPEKAKEYDETYLTNYCNGKFYYRTYTDEDIKAIALAMNYIIEHNEDWNKTIYEAKLFESKMKKELGVDDYNILINYLTELGYIQIDFENFDLGNQAYWVLKSNFDTSKE